MCAAYHDGELEVQRRAGARAQARAVSRAVFSRIPAAAAGFLARQRFVVVSSLGPDGDVWASLLSGPKGFLSAVDDELLRVGAQPLAGDPLNKNLGARPELGLLAFDSTTRQRMRFNGRGLLAAEGVFLEVEQAYGNCAKYIQLRRPLADDDGRVAEVPRASTALDERQRAWIETADTFFIASFHPEGGADASHRGGRPGFVRLVDPERLAFDHYPGNGMFNTMGNLVAYPRAGLLFVDFASGDLLQLTGSARLDSNLSLTFSIAQVRETPRGSALRYALVEYSPFHPPPSDHGAAHLHSRRNQ